MSIVNFHTIKVGATSTKLWPKVAKLLKIGRKSRDLWPILLALGLYYQSGQIFTTKLEPCNLLEISMMRSGFGIERLKGTNFWPNLGFRHSQLFWRCFLQFRNILKN